MLQIFPVTLKLYPQSRKLSSVDALLCPVPVSGRLEMTPSALEFELLLKPEGF